MFFANELHRESLECIRNKAEAIDKILHAKQVEHIITVFMTYNELIEVITLIKAKFSC